MPLAWPIFAGQDDLEGLPPVMISVNECDPLRDEGIEFYRTLLRAGVPARCRQVMGTIHATEIFQMACPDVSRETAASLVGVGGLEVHQDDRQVALEVLLLVDGEGDVARLDRIEKLRRHVEATDGEIDAAVR